MINLKDYREHPEKYHKGAADKGHDIDRKQFDALDTQVRELKFQLDELSAKRNELSKSIQTMEKGSDAFQKVVAQVQAMKGELTDKETAYEEQYALFQSILLRIPSPALADVPV